MMNSIPKRAQGARRSCWLPIGTLLPLNQKGEDELMKTPIQKRGDQIIDKCHRERERVQEAFARFNAAAKHLQRLMARAA